MEKMPIMTQTESNVTACPGVPSADLPELVAAIVADAVKQGATDIHLDTWGDYGTLRFRVDGVIREREPLASEQARRLLNQLKVAARLDFEATRRAQEGQFRWTDGQRVRDIRVTLIPEAPRNESAHLRVLTRPEDWRHMENLGLRPEQLVAVRKIMQWPHGLVLVPGPTGPGKTTTLCALTSVDRGAPDVMAGGM
jgi:type II secretory ATPase GspE/PulE/Tfp pilus assembly ATPase PilB-like protein